MKRPADREEQLFVAALMLPSGERGRFLEIACDSDPLLHARLVRLVEATDSSAALFDGSDVKTRRAGVEHQIGPYSVLQEIGEGGCGVVYLAEQTHPVRRQVALKVIKLGMDTNEVIARFAAERQALALMDHPNIAKVLDAGATPAGRPFFAMELVRGIKITDYCAQIRASMRDRIALFIQVCLALEHAHQKSIVHRDIKPSNVLVTLCDGTAIVKVIDFGIAKAMRGRLTEQTLSTAVGQIVGTPEYISPEQTIPGSGHVDRRTDIYSLGVLLYELLTGNTPFGIASATRRTVDAAGSSLHATEPICPSAYLRRSTRAHSDEHAIPCATTAVQWMRQVRGDLDWIVMRCLEKDRTRRYQTVEDLRLDLQRYLDDEPVVARPHRISYTFMKFARRHRAIFTTGATIITVLLMASIVTTVLAVRARQDRQIAQEIARFLQKDLLAQAAPTYEPDRNIKLRTVLDRAAAKVDSRFKEQPLVEAAIRETLGTTYRSLGEYWKARQQLERAIRIYREQIGPADRRTLQVMRLLVSVLTGQGAYREGEALGIEALRLHRRFIGPHDPQTLVMATTLADVYMNVGKYSEGESLLEPLLPHVQRRLGPEHPDTLQFMTILGGNYVGRSKHTAAEGLGTSILAASKRLWGAQHPDTIQAMHNLGVIYIHMGRFSQSEALLVEALELARKILGREHPRTLDTMRALALVYWQQGRADEEEALASEVVDISTRVLGPTHRETLTAMNNLAKAYVERGKFLSKAERLQSQVVKDVSRVLGPEHRTTIGFKLNLALILASRKSWTDAEALLSEGAATAARVLGENDHYTLEYLDQLGAVLIAQGRFAEAETALRKALRGFETYTPGNWWVADPASQYEWQKFATQSRLGEALAGLQRFAEAEALLLSGYEGLQQRANRPQAKYKPDLDQAGARILELYQRWGRSSQAQQWGRALAQRAHGA